jgi:hypothetical protein
MILECEHCGSHNYKIDYIEGYSGQTEVKCVMCGRKKFKEVDVSNKICSVEGCVRKSIVDGVCWTHYHDKYGVPYKPKTSMPRKQKQPEEVKPKQSGIASEDTNIKPYTPLPKILTTSITLNFEEYKELFEAIKENAHNEMRTPEMQVLWILKSLLDRAA